ncbi:MAG: phenylacetate--CoA ligase family protein, partial [Promethearchaeota archaeon]
GDIATCCNKKCDCGRVYRIINSIEGRKEEFLVDIDGSLISFIAHEICLWDFKDKINAYRFVQSKKGKVLLEIDAKKNFCTSDIERIKMIFFKYYSRFDLEIDFVKKIPRTPEGKFRFLIQKLPVKLHTA